MNLSYTSLRKIPEGMQRLPLHALNISGNSLRSLSGLPTSLQVLDAKDNTLNLDEIFYSHPHLESLNISKNDLPMIDGSEIETCFPSLQELDVSKNRLVSLGVLKHTRIQRLNVSENDLRLLDTLPSTLKSLDAKRCEIRMIQSRLPPTTEEVQLSYNYLRYAGLPMNWGTSLRQLQLDKNSIEKFPRNLPETLEVLTLSHNQIEVLPVKLPTNLKVLNLTDNYIRVFPTYKHSNKFMMLLLSNNYLIDTPDGSVATVLKTDLNWTTPRHDEAQRVLKKCWKRYVFLLRLRHYKRTNVIKEDLFSVSMMPERCLQVISADSQWLRRT